MKLKEYRTGNTFVLLSSVQFMAEKGAGVVTENGLPLGLHIYRVGVGATTDEPRPLADNLFVISNDGFIRQMDGDTEIVPCS